MTDVAAPQTPGDDTAFVIDPSGNVGIGLSAPAARLDVDGDTHVRGTLNVTTTISAQDFHGDGAALTVGAGMLGATLDTKLDKAGGAVGPLQVGGALAVSGALTVADVGGTGDGPVQFTSPVVVPNLLSLNLNQHSMYPMMGGSLIYQDVFAAVAAGAIARMGTSSSYNDHSYATSNWNGKRSRISFGNGNEPDGNGALLNVPAQFDTAWIRVSGNVRTVVKAWSLSQPGRAWLWQGGRHQSNSYCPDGSATDGTGATNQWMPIPVVTSGQLALVPKPTTDDYFWITGVAFSRNPWGHAVQGPDGYASALNGGTRLSLNGSQNELDASIAHGTAPVLKVPVVPTGRDKVVYMVVRNDGQANELAHTAVSVNDQPIGRFYTTFENPFARHWNSQYLRRYIAALVPARMVGTNPTIDVIVDMTHQDDGDLNFSELGTHDFDVPLG